MVPTRTRESGHRRRIRRSSLFLEGRDGTAPPADWTTTTCDGLSPTWPFVVPSWICFRRTALDRGRRMTTSRLRLLLLLCQPRPACPARRYAASSRRDEPPPTPTTKTSPRRATTAGTAEAPRASIARPRRLPRIPPNPATRNVFSFSSRRKRRRRIR